MTGFRSFVVRGNAFELNGKPVVLKGACRHDLWQDQGFTLTREQMAQDMRMIKALGANFVRLVHYPHHRHVVELADELGLMVSEEPGYWQVDFKTADRPVIDAGPRILERTIKRDWNSPSVVAWLLANESFNTESYILEGQALCRSLDALQRPVSQAGPIGKGDLVPMTLSSRLYQLFAMMPHTPGSRALVADTIRTEWSKMVFAGATSFWETGLGGDDFDDAGSLCHGWSALPVYYYLAWVLGVRPQEPGFKRFVINPYAGGFTHASGSVPTPSGPISVEWERTPRGLTIEATGPKDLRPEVQSHPECPVTRARYNGVAFAPK